MFLEVHVLSHYKGKVLPEDEKIVIVLNIANGGIMNKAAWHRFLFITTVY